MIKLLIDAHVFDGKYQGTRTYIQGIYSAMVTHKDIEFYFAAQNRILYSGLLKIYII